MPRITPVIGMTSMKPRTPKYGMSWVSICSEPYAEDEIMSMPMIPSAVGLLSFSPCSSSLTSGLPSSRRFHR